MTFSVRTGGFSPGLALSPGAPLWRATFSPDNAQLTRAFSIVGDELTFTDPHASAGGAATVTFKRAN